MICPHCGSIYVERINREYYCTTCSKSWPVPEKHVPTIAIRVPE
jgi:DNA-directed RNA polymerase subunit RPC12/RpoP